MDDNDLTELARGVVPFVHEAIAEALAKVPPPPVPPAPPAPTVPPELAEQVAHAVRMLHELPPIVEPKPVPSPPPPPPKVIRIERDANGSMVPIYSEP